LKLSNTLPLLVLLQLETLISKTVWQLAIVADEAMAMLSADMIQDSLVFSDLALLIVIGIVSRSILVLKRSVSIGSTRTEVTELRLP